MVADLKKLSNYRLIAVKIGSSLLVDPVRGLKNDWLASVAKDISWLRGQGKEVIVVSSGAIALGRTLLGLPRRSLKLEESQAAAACGQISLARAWTEALGAHAVTAGQILLTLDDTQERRRYLNARSTMQTLLKLGAVPVINENDSVATTEIRYGDNDRLAARVATMIGADLLVLLSDVDGLYDAPPLENAQARLIEHVESITPEIAACAGGAGTDLSRGGMVTKIEAGRIATAAGVTMAITSGQHMHPLRRLMEGSRATWFAPNGNPVTARKKWISGQLPGAGAITVDEGALRALRLGKSLLPAGVRDVCGAFARGDLVRILDLAGREAGRGLIAYDAEDARRIAGRKSSEIELLLGYSGRNAMIHRDDLVLNSALPRQEAIAESEVTHHA